MPTTTHTLHFPRRAAVCSALVALAAGGACASAQAAAPPAGSPVLTPPASAVSVPRSGVLTVPMQCGTAAPVLRVAEARVAGRCTEGLAARFVISPKLRGTLRTAAPATVQAGGVVRRLKLTAAPAAHAAAITGTWNDATLDCYPPGGGRLGGGPNNSSVDLILNWRSADSTTFWARHAVFFEEYWNGAGPYYRTPSGEYTSTTPYYGPYRISPSGVIEWMTSVPTYGFGGSITRIDPWISEQTYPKSVHIQVRAQVALQTYTGGWNAPTWHFAHTINAPLGYATGICALN